MTSAELVATKVTLLDAYAQGGGKRLKYVAVAMNLPSTGLIGKRIVALDECVRANNGLA